MKEDRIMSFQMSKKLGQIDLDKVSGGVDKNMSSASVLTPSHYILDDSGMSVTLDNCPTI